MNRYSKTGHEQWQICFISNKNNNKKSAMLDEILLLAFTMLMIAL
jgi:hypothetical protein